MLLEEGVGGWGTVCYVWFMSSWCLKWWKLLGVLVLAGTFGSPSLPVTNSKTPEKSFISLTKWQVQPLCHRWCEDIMRWSNLSGRNSCTPVSRYLVICGASGIKGTLSRVFSLSKCVAPACAALIWSRLLINFGIGLEDKKGDGYVHHWNTYLPVPHPCKRNQWVIVYQNLDAQ